MKWKSRLLFEPDESEAKGNKKEGENDPFLKQEQDSGVVSTTAEGANVTLPLSVSFFLRNAPAVLAFGPITLPDKFIQSIQRCFIDDAEARHQLSIELCAGGFAQDGKCRFMGALGAIFTACGDRRISVGDGNNARRQRYLVAG